MDAWSRFATSSPKRPRTPARRRTGRRRTSAAASSECAGRPPRGASRTGSSPSRAARPKRSTCACVRARAESWLRDRRQRSARTSFHQRSRKRRRRRAARLSASATNRAQEGGQLARQATSGRRGHRARAGRRNEGFAALLVDAHQPRLIAQGSHRKMLVSGGSFQVALWPSLRAPYCGPSAERPASSSTIRVSSSSLSTAFFASRAGIGCGV